MNLRVRPLPLAFALLAVLAVGSGCSDDRHVRSYEVPKSTESAAPSPMGGAGMLPAGGGAGLTWTTPAGWEEAPGSSMRLASFRAPYGDAGETGDCSIVSLGGPAGGLAANVNRWRGQIGLDPQAPDAILAGARSDTGRLGEFRLFRLVNPSLPGQAVLAAMIPHAGQTVFVKLAAPAAALDILEPGFLSLCRSLDASTS